MTMQSSTVTQEYFDAMAETWDVHNKADPALLQSIVSAANLPPGARILDVACGTGVMFAPLLNTEPCLLRAIDISSKMVHVAQQKFPGHPVLQVSNDDFYLFRETGFDLIMVYNAYPHFMDKALFANQLSLCLASGGRFIIAHGAGKERINACHAERSVVPLSTPLLARRDETEQLGTAFHFDIAMDCEHVYLLSGRKGM